MLLLLLCNKKNKEYLSCKLKSFLRSAPSSPIVNVLFAVRALTQSRINFDHFVAQRMSGLRLVRVSFPKDSGDKKGKGVSKVSNLSHTQSSKVVLSQKKDVDRRLPELKKEHKSHLHATLSDGRMTKQDHDANIQFAESVYDSLLVNEYAFDPSWVEGRTHHIMTFRARSKEVRLILASLNSFGIGLHFGRIDLSELTASIPAVKHAKNVDREGKLKWCSCLTKCLGKRSYSSSDRMTLQEIHSIVDGQTHLTCEYLTLVLVAALIASVGLRRNSATTVISSMLVSPLMGMYCSFCGLGRFYRHVFFCPELQILTSWK